MKFCQLAKKIFLDQQQQSMIDECQSLSNTLRSVPDRKLNRYREQVFLWMKQICDSFPLSSSKNPSTKINENFLHERLAPSTRAIFIRELTNTNHWRLGQKPDLAILYRIFAESGTKIPLSDWFEV